MEKKDFIKLLRNLADTLEKESVEIKEGNFNTVVSSVEGVDPKNYQWKTHHPDGYLDFNISLRIYDSERDKSSEAFIPIPYNTK